MATEANGNPLDLLTPEQVAQRFQISPRTVRFHAQTAELPAVRVGRQWRFRPADLERYLSRQRNGGRD